MSNPLATTALLCHGKHVPSSFTQKLGPRLGLATGPCTRATRTGPPAPTVKLDKQTRKQSLLFLSKLELKIMSITSYLKQRKTTIIFKAKAIRSNQPKQTTPNFDILN